MSDITTKLEMAIVRGLVQELALAGFVPVKVWDGEEYQEASNAGEAVEAIFSVDVSILHFAPESNPNKWGKTGVMLVCGNGEEIISDWHCGNADFEAAVQRVCGKIDSAEVTL